METLTAVLALLVIVAGLVETARWTGIPYPVLLVIGGLALAFVPGVPRIELEPELILLVFLPPLLFRAAFETSLRDLRANLGPIARLSIGLVALTIVLVAVVAQAAVPGLGWPAALTLGAIVSPTDPLAATTVLRRLHVPQRLVTILEGEGLLNDATALVAYRAAVAAVVTGALAFSDIAAAFLVAAVGGILFGGAVGLLSAQVLRRLDDPPVEVAVSLVIPYAAFLPADELGLSAVLATVVAGLIVGRRSALVSSPESRTLGLATWKMVAFLLNGFAFILIGLELPVALRGLAQYSPMELLGLALLVSATVIAARFAWIYAVSLLPGSVVRTMARTDPVLAARAPLIASWAGFRGAVSLAAALALPIDFPERHLLILLTFAVILATLLGQGLTLPLLLRRMTWAGSPAELSEETRARIAAFQAGLAAIERERSLWPSHQPLLDRLESSIGDRNRHLATDDPEETEERQLERAEHEEIQRRVIAAQRLAVIGLRDSGEINDETLRTIERELDFEELRMEG